MMFRVLSAAILALGLAEAAVAQQVATQNETVGDWQIECGSAANGGQCALSQTLMQANTNQRVVALSLQEADQGRMSGTLLLPFGLVLSAGVRLSIGETALDTPLPFGICLPVGCLVKTGFETDILDRFAKGDSFSATVIIADSGDATTFTLQMDGLDAARIRAREIDRARQ